MKKRNQFWSMLTIILVTALSIGFAACGDGDNDDKSSNSNIVGTWTGQDGGVSITLTFNSNFTGLYVESYKDSYSGKESVSTTFTYSVVDETKAIMVVKVPDQWYSGRSTETYYIVINGKSMSIYDDDFYDDLEYVLTKQ